MKDKITLNNFILMIVGFILFAFIIVPIGETLIYNSRYSNPNKELVQLENDDFEMCINKFDAASREGFINVDLVKKNDKWKYAEVQVLDKDGYIIHREYKDLSDIREGSKFNMDFSYFGEDAASLNIVGSNEIKERDTTFNRIKNKFKESKLFDRVKESKVYKAIENFYENKVKDKLNIDFDKVEKQIRELPSWLKGTYSASMAWLYSLDPGLRAIGIIFIASMFI